MEEENIGRELRQAEQSRDRALEFILKSGLYHEYMHFLRECSGDAHDNCYDLLLAETAKMDSLWGDMRVRS